MLEILDDAQIVEEFLKTRVSKCTRENYSRWLKAIVKDPAEFLGKARQNKWQAQTLIIDWIMENRDRLASSSIQSMVASVESLCDYAEITLAWKKIHSVQKKVNVIGSDIPAPFDKVQEMYESSDLRMKWILGLFMSGIRVGAFDYFKQKHLQEIKVEKISFGVLKVYPGELEEYTAFLTPEAIANYHAYLDLRRRYGEKLNPESPLVRDAIGPHSLTPELAWQTSSGAIAQLMSKAWIDLGYRERNWKECHGLRKLFETRMVDAGCKKECVEHMIGHKDAYYKPDEVKILLVEFSKYYQCAELSKFRSSERVAEKAMEEKEKLESKVETELRLLRLEAEANRRKMVEFEEIMKQYS